MPKNRTDITVANIAALALVHVAELDDGCWAWVVADSVYYTLQKNSGAAPGVGVVAPVAGSPIAGAANARWILEAVGSDATSIQGEPVSASTPVNGDMLIFDGTTWSLSHTDLGLFRAFDVGGNHTAFLFDGDATVTFAQSAAGADGFDFFIETTTPPAIGARAAAGSIQMTTGNGAGNAGAGAAGGDFIRTAGQGSDNGGRGGNITETTGAGGAGGGSAGQYRIVLGVPNGGGNQGTWEVFQGGSGGDPVLLLDGGGRLHVGKDSDTAAGPVRLRVNGLSLATVGAAGGAAAQPATPLGYLQVDINGTVVAVPFHNAA
jgi:hypothetical protein